MFTTSSERWSLWCAKRWWNCRYDPLFEAGYVINTSSSDGHEMSLHVATNLLPGVGNGGGGLSVGKTSVALTRKLTTRELSSSPTPWRWLQIVCPPLLEDKRGFSGLGRLRTTSPSSCIRGPTVKPAFKIEALKYSPPSMNVRLWIGVNFS